MQALQVFNFEAQEVRTILKDGEPWFIAKDVCEILGLLNVSGSLKKLREKEKSILDNSDIHPMYIGMTTDIGVINNKGISIISESGLYRLIFRSDKEIAQNFQDWVIEAVLPQIRKTGSFNGSNKQLEQLFSKFTNLKEIVYQQQSEILELKHTQLRLVPLLPPTEMEVNTLKNSIVELVEAFMNCPSNASSLKVLHEWVMLPSHYAKICKGTSITTKIKDHEHFLSMSIDYNTLKCLLINAKALPVDAPVADTKEYPNPWSGE